MLMPKECADVGVMSVSFPLTTSAIREHVVGMRIYVRTRYIILKNGLKYAVVGIRKSRPTYTPSGEKNLFCSILGVRVLALPHETVYMTTPSGICDDSIDVLNPTQMCSIALSLKTRCLIARGRSEHIGFVIDPELIDVHVYDFVPPRPPKLVSMIRDALPLIRYPIRIHEHVIDLNKMVCRASCEQVVLPCHVEHMQHHPDKSIYYLHDTPGLERDVTLIGCHVSERILSELYPGVRVRQFINFCPLDARRRGFAIVRCCNIRSGYRIEGRTVCVPHGARLDVVARAVNRLTANACKS